MKTLTTILMAIIAVGLTYGQNVCSKYYAMGEGTTFQLTSFEGKKVSAIVDYLVAESGSTAAGERALMKTEIKDKDGEVVSGSEFEIICEDDIVYVDFKSLMGPETLAQFPDMDIEVSGTALQLPNNLREGQNLPDADMLAVVHMNPIKMRLTFIMTNRKVVGRETITTPAGTFDCIVLSYDYESKMGIKVTGSTKQWFAEGVGLVLQKDYNKKKREVRKTELTKFQI